jgi:hypothetical protein
MVLILGGITCPLKVYIKGLLSVPSDANVPALVANRHPHIFDNMEDSS